MGTARKVHWLAAEVQNRAGIYIAPERESHSASRILIMRRMVVRPHGKERSLFLIHSAEMVGINGTVLLPLSGSTARLLPSQGIAAKREVNEVWLSCAVVRCVECCA